MEIVVYTQTICPKCEALKKGLHEKGIVFKEINVDKDKDALLDLLMNQISGTPAVRINDVWLYDPTVKDVLEAKLKER